MELSVAIITFNEEKNIARCINSISSIADDILVVDSFSTDKTKGISISLGARFIENQFEGHIEQKNFALRAAKFDYVLSLDADEALSENAIKEIARLKSNNKFAHVEFNRITNYCGKWIKHCGWYPDKKLRLIDRRHAQWGGENPHDRLIEDGQITVSYCTADILHYSFPTISSHATTANKFSEIAAKQATEKNKRIYFIFHVIGNPIFTFIKKYIFQLGMLDGFYGFVICVLSAHSNFLKYSKIWHLKRENSNLQDR